MSEHRRKWRYRKTAVVAVALATVGVPSVAMACMDRQDDAGSESYGWKSASHTGDWADKQQWARGHDWAKAKAEAKAEARAKAKAKVKAKASPKPSATASPTATAARSVTASSAPASAAAASGATAQVVALVNSARKEAGCAALTVNAKLTTAAQSHSEDMADHQTMSHTGSDGSSPGTRITRAGYSWSSYGENVAYGYDTPASVMDGWMSSPGHKANILNCAFKEIGVGLAQPGSYWTQDFGTPR